MSNHDYCDYCGALGPVELDADNDLVACEACIEFGHEQDAEYAQDEILAQQELEDFEQADEYFGYDCECEW